MRAPALVCAATLTVALVTVACVDPSSSPNVTEPASILHLSGVGPCPYDFNSSPANESEEELFGDISASLGLTGDATLTRRSSGQPESLALPLNYAKECRSGLNGDGPGHANNGAEYGWYSPFDVEYHCGDNERHRDSAQAFLNETEAHCAGDEAFLLVIAGNIRTSRPVDFIRYNPSHSIPGDTLEASDRTAAVWIDRGTVMHRDLKVDYADTAGPSIAPVVQISPKPLALLYSDKWRSQPEVNGEVHVPINYWLRVNSWATVGAVPKETLVRYFWNYGVDNSESGRTGFVNVALDDGSEPDSHVRTYQYHSTGVYELVAHFLQPGDMPAAGYDPADIETGTAHSVTIQVHDELAAELSVSSANPHLIDSVITFTATGGNGGGGITYEWDFGDGVSTSTSSNYANHVYTTVGTKTVALVKRDQYGYAQGDVIQLEITEPEERTDLQVRAAPNNAAGSNTVKPNQTCLWLAQSNMDSTYFTWQRFMGVWKWAPPGNPLSVSTGSGSGSMQYRLIGSRPPLADTFNFTITVSSGGQVCDGW